MLFVPVFFDVNNLRLKLVQVCLAKPFCLGTFKGPLSLRHYDEAAMCELWLSPVGAEGTGARVSVDRNHE